MLILELGAGGFWLTAYLLLIRRGFRDQACGMPMTALCLNAANEMVSTFFYPPGLAFQRAVYGAWFVLDLVVFWQFIRFRRADPIPNLPEKFFFPTLFVTSALAFALQITVFREFDDLRHIPPPFGCLVAGFGAALVMGVLFVSMLFRRPDLRGQSLYIGTCKMLGTAAYALEYARYALSSPLLVTLMLATAFFDAAYVALYYGKARRLGHNPWLRV